ncbi:hypothetical protein NBT05_13130 [Aquimarina sp. ERC-38]|uniref:hypothetical protein n=1 Tax=Aquimarina sp. ERC-38 TaxID=2949996 RepID=UPI00224728D0|nr:hypothetical protein [Aquimarina sp. ERC-38]UZO79887.1 hypothetical protein NBT05_13130 [Aquimarina sp. ERC-38]
MKFFTFLTFFIALIFIGNLDSYGQESPWLKKNSTLKTIEPPVAKKEVPVVKRDKYSKAEHEVKILEARILSEESRLEGTAELNDNGEALSEEKKAIIRKNLQFARQKLSQLKAQAGISQSPE